MADDSITSLVADDLLDMIDTVPVSTRIGAKFFMDSSIVSILRKQKASVAGQYIFSGPEGGKPASV